MNIADAVEAADNLDDETALQNYLGGGVSVTSDCGSVDLPDWPAPAKREAGLEVDVETLNWFKQRHADWRREIRFVLRAWVAAKATKLRTSVNPTLAAATISSGGA